MLNPNPPKMTGRAADEWAKLQGLVEADIERQIDEKIEDEHERERANDVLLKGQ